MPSVTNDIAIVEDDPSTRELLVELLEQRGHTVQAFSERGPAHEHLQQNAPSLLIVDVSLPDGSGLDLLSRLLDYHGAGTFPTLVLSGLSSESDILRGYAAGADDYLTKPFKPDELLAKVTVLLARRGPKGAPAPPGGEPELPSSSGLVFGRYRQLRVLGRGAYGTVYEARDTQDNQTVALKVLSAIQGRMPENRFRFLRETYALSGLHHPNIVRVLDFGIQEGRLYYAMELVTGATLYQEVRAQRLNEAELLQVLIPLADALEALRENDLIHRDLKPSNIVLRASRLDQPVLIDFGLSKHSFDRGLTDPNVIMGTPGYLPPEIYLGEEYNHRSDLWALGMVARLALSGHDLWPHLDAYTLFRRFAERDVPLPPIDSQPLLALLRRLLDREPSLRYATAGEVAEDLRSLQEEIGTPLAPDQGVV
jgi:DNA-binding response OmpR family regulator